MELIDIKTQLKLQLEYMIWKTSPAALDKVQSDKKTNVIFIAFVFCSRDLWKVVDQINEAIVRSRDSRPHSEQTNHNNRQEVAGLKADYTKKLSPYP